MYIENHLVWCRSFVRNSAPSIGGDVIRQEVKRSTKYYFLGSERFCVWPHCARRSPSFKFGTYTIRRCISVFSDNGMWSQFRMEDDGCTQIMSSELSITYENVDLNFTWIAAARWWITFSQVSGFGFRIVYIGFVTPGSGYDHRRLVLVSARTDYLCGVPTTFGYGTIAVVGLSTATHPHPGFLIICSRHLVQVCKPWRREWTLSLSYSEYPELANNLVHRWSLIQFLCLSKRFVTYIIGYHQSTVPNSYEHGVGNEVSGCRIYTRVVKMHCRICLGGLEPCSVSWNTTPSWAVWIEMSRFILWFVPESAVTLVNNETNIGEPAAANCMHKTEQ